MQWYIWQWWHERVIKMKICHKQPSTLKRRNDWTDNSGKPLKPCTCKTSFCQWLILFWIDRTIITFVVLDTTALIVHVLYLAGMQWKKDTVTIHVVFQTLYFPLRKSCSVNQFGWNCRNTLHSLICKLRAPLNDLQGVKKYLTNLKNYNKELKTITASLILQNVLQHLKIFV